MRRLKTIAVCLLATVPLTSTPVLTSGCDKERNMKLSSKSPVKNDPRTLTPEEVAALATAAVRNEFGSDVTMKMTPPFPATWPPAGNRTVVYFAYSREGLPTGMVRYQVYSPFARVELSITSGTTAALHLTRLKPRLLPYTETESLRGDPAEQTTAAQEALFKLITSPAPSRFNPALAEPMRRTYQAWIGQHSGLATVIRKHVPQFFAWLETSTPKPSAP